MELGQKLYALRKEKGLTLEQVGDFVGVGKSTVRKWENGMIENMRRDKVAKLAQCLGVSPAYLMGWEDNSTTINNGIVGDHNSHNVIQIGTETLGEVELELVSLCKRMSIKDKTKLLSYAYKLVEEDN